MRPHTRHAGHDADRFFQGPRDAEDNLPSSERRTLRDNGDAGKAQLGIDRRWQAQRGPDARGAQNRDDQINETPLAAENVEQRHGLFVPILALSVTPYAPVVTTVSPPASPLTISARVSVRAPTVTGRACAIPAESTT